MNKGTANIICKLDDNALTVLFIDRTHQIDPYRVQGLTSLEYDSVNHAYILDFGGNVFTVPLADYDMYLLTK